MDTALFQVNLRKNRYKPTLSVFLCYSNLSLQPPICEQAPGERNKMDERKKKSDFPREARARYFDRSPVPMAELSLDDLPRSDTHSPATPKIPLTPNRAFCALFGREDAVQVTALDSRTMEPGDIDELVSLLRSLPEGGSRVSRTMSVRRRDGRAVALEFRVDRQEGAGEPILMTAQERTPVTELTRQLNLLSLLPETNPDLIFLEGEGGELLYMNPAARVWLRERELTPQQGLAALCRGAAAGDGRDSFLVDHEKRRYRVRVAGMPGTEQRMVIASDITEDVQLRVEHDLFRRAFNKSSNPMVITDQAGHIEQINSAFTSFFGYTEEEARGKNPRILNPGRDVYLDLGVERDAYDELFSRMWKELTEQGRFEGEEIPLSARIVALADVYDALRSKRPYKEPWPHEEARKELLSVTGRHLCPEVVAAFEKIEGDFEQISLSHGDQEQTPV